MFMKKNSAIYLALFSLLFIGVSCVSSTESEVETSPYALISSFNLGNVKSKYPAFTSDGRDTTVVKTVNLSVYPFAINQATGEIYNNDSLPYSTDVTKLVTSLSSTGVVGIYVDSTETYEAYSTSDSIDFSTLRKLRVYSSDAAFYKDYTLSVNVHRLDPDLMVWNRSVAPENIVPERAVEFLGDMYVYGRDNEGVAVVSVSHLSGEVAWGGGVLSGLPSNIDFSTLQRFGDRLFVVASGDLYSSSTAYDWSPVLQGCGLVAITAVSDDEDRIEVASESLFYSSTDGVNFMEEAPVPEGYPLYGVSLASYPLSHNNSIIRYMAVGYTTPEEDSGVSVWSRLSTDSGWVEYENSTNSFPCPSLKGLSVVRYDNSLYAVGGDGKAGETDVQAFASFYISKDNGIVWKEPSGFYQRLPKELAGNNSAFAVAVDSNNNLWIVVSGADGGTWKGIINRLGFKE